MTKLTVDGATIHLLGDNFIHTVYEDNCLLNAAHLEKIRKAYSSLYGDEDLSQLRLLVEFKGEIDIPKDIGERYIGNRVRKKIAEALVSTNPRTREYLKGASALMSRTHQVRVFSDLEEAKNWLEEI